MTDFVRIDVDMGKVPTLMTRLKKQQGLKTGLAVGATYLKGKLATYPTRRYGKAVWSSDPAKRYRQIRGFFAKLKAGEIDVPYRRGQSPGSQRLGQRWTTEARNNGFTQVVGNNASYAPLVQAAKKQTQYHKQTGWITDEKVVKQEGARVVEIVGSYVQKDL